MQRAWHRSPFYLALACGAVVLCGSLVWAQEDSAAEEARQQQVVERFLSVLEKNPRRGTALDRVYGHYVERGTLEQLVQRYTERTRSQPADGTSWMMLGLLEGQRGKDAQAAAAFRKAEEHSPANPLASYYLGQSLVLIGQPDEAAAAFERAITRKPNPADLLEIFQALGRVHQRAQRSEAALAVWKRLEQLFPGDQRVQEQIATTLVEEGQLADALLRYTGLATAAKDRYRQSLFRMEAAELKVRLGRTPEALADFERLLSDLNPDSWLHRDVRGRIDEVFLRTDDQAGLAKYYETWIERHKDDVDAMARLARILAGQSRVAEAQQWLERALKLAPSRKELRVAFIEQLVYDRRFSDAIAQYEALDKVEPNNPDYLRDWGKLILKDTSRGEVQRKQAAAAVWRRLAEARPNDSLAAVQAADLFRQAELHDEALKLYQKAIELSPDAPQYREYLGEYHHTQKRSDEALAVWRQMADGKNRTAKNLARLSEVLAGFGYQEEALKSLAEACRLEPDEFNLLIQHAGLLSTAGQHAEALNQLAAAERLAQSTDERETILEQRIKFLQAASTLADEIEQLEKATPVAAQAAQHWYLLARYREAARQMTEAGVAIGKALEIEPQSLPLLAAAARIHEAAGSIQEAAEMNRKLAAIDRRYRTDYLTNVARLESRLGRRDQALQAGRDLLTAAPGNADHYEFFAQLCFQLGENEEGLDALRRSVRANPAEARVLLTLAAALGDLFRTDEAIELYWRAFEKSPELDAKLSVISKLTELYLQINHFGRLVDRLDRGRREADQQREMTICLAQAYQSAGDYGAARQELERLLAQDSRDTQLLQQLSTLAETEGDIALAARYQQQLCSVAPSKETEMRLAQLLLRQGETEEASALVTRLTLNDTDLDRAIKALDSLQASGRHETVLAIVEHMLREHPNNWELLYREAAALVSSNPAKADERFEALLHLTLALDEPSEAAKAQKRQRNARPATARQSPAGITPSPAILRSQSVYSIRQATGLLNEEYYSSTPIRWTPADFGQARMASLAWMMVAARKQNKLDTFLAARRAAAEKTTDGRSLAQWDWYNMQLLRNDTRGTYEAALALSRTGDVDGQVLYLQSLPQRFGNQAILSRSGEPDNLPPLADEELEHMLACYRSVLQAKSSSLNYSGAITYVFAELKRAKRSETETELYQQFVEAAKTPYEIALAMNQAGTRGDVALTMELFDRLLKVETQTAFPQAYSHLASAGSLIARDVHTLAESKSHAQALKLMDRYWDALLARKRTVAATRRPATATSTVQRNYVTIYQGRSLRSVQMDFPTPNEHFDSGSLSILRNAYEAYRKDDLTSDLLDHYRGKIKTLSPADRLLRQLALGYLLWWEDDRDAAIDQLQAAAAASPGDVTLLLQLSLAQERDNRFQDALETLESFTPKDNSEMQQRETAALRLAVRAGDIPRARQAAERLFGLRLDANLQVELASQMQQLGMHELAEAVAGRAQRQAGNRISTLVGVMQQYEAQAKPELAAQVAFQILRRAQPQAAGGGAGSAMSSSSRTEGDMARANAIQSLSRSGKLKELIARAEAQLERSPKSLPLHQLLGEYYQAAGDKEKQKSLEQKLLELSPDNPQVAMQLAQQKTRSGDYAGAAPLYLAALKKDPSLYARDYSTIVRSFQQAKKLDELAAILESTDLRSLGGRSYTVSYAMQYLLQDPKTKEAGARLLRKAWDAYPAERNDLFAYLSSTDASQLGDLFELLRQAIIPSEATPPTDPWMGVNTVRSFGGDGRVSGPLSQFLQAAQQQNKLPQVAAEVEQTMQKLPQWKGGPVLLGLVKLRQGQLEGASQLLRQQLGDPKAALPLYMRWLVAQELDAHATLRDLAIQLYEGGAEESMAQYDLSYSPVRRLVGIYKQDGRSEEARKLLLRFTKVPPQGYSSTPGYNEERSLRSLQSQAKELLDLGYPIDAARLYSEILSDPQRIAAAATYRRNDTYTKSAQDGLQRAIDALKPDSAADLTQLLRPAEKSSGAAAVDLLLLIHPRELTRAELTSLLSTVLRGAVGKPDLVRQAETHLASLAADHPQDLSVPIAAALLAAARNNDEQLAAAVQKLDQMIQQTPLEALPPGGRPNARHRAEAARQIPLWLVARECLRRESLAPTGNRLAQRAMEAARRQSNPEHVLAMLRESGQRALDRGDRKTAEAQWTEMLELVLPQSSRLAPRDVSGASLDFPLPIGSSGHPSLLAALLTCRGATGLLLAYQPAPARPAGVPPLTMPQFEQALEISKLAADNGMPALSLRAAREAFRPGPPIDVRPTSGAGFGAAVRSPFSSSSTSSAESTASAELYRRIEERLTPLVQQWQRQDFPADEVYQVLLSAVMPESRPGEIFLYPKPLAQGANRNPQSIGRVLVQWSVTARQQDDLKQRLASRQEQPLAIVPAHVLGVQLAMAAADEPWASQNLAWLAERLQKETLQNTAELACHAALPALDDPKLAGKAAPVIDVAVKNLSTRSTTEEPAASLYLELARLHLKANDAAAGRLQIDRYLEHSQRVTARDSGSYSLYRRKQHLQRAASELAAGGLVKETLDLLGQTLDIQAPDYGEVSVDPTMRLLGPRLASLPAEERYQTLRQWCLPNESRRTVRLAAVFAPAPAKPPEFQAAPAQPLSTLGLLIDAAAELGKLPELLADAERLSAEKVQGAEPLVQLVRLAANQREQARSDLAARAKELAKPADPDATTANRVTGVEWGDFLMARTALRDPQTSEAAELLARQLILRAQRTQNWLMLSHLRSELTLASVGRQSGLPLTPSADPGLALWRPAVHQTALSHRTGTVAPWWVAQAGHIAHLAGPEHDLLYFAFPLVGKFEFSVDAFHGGWAEGNLGYGGLIFEALHNAGGQSIWPVGRHESVRLRHPFTRTEAFNRLSVRVAEDGVRYFINGRQVHHDADASPTSPWLCLYAHQPRQTAFRNLSLTGEAHIPREVQLTAGDRLEGWISSFYAEQQPPRRSINQTGNSYDEYGNALSVTLDTRPDAYDWSAKGGVIRGRRVPTSGKPLESRLYYHRPLAAGETLRYEFYHQPGDSMAHPTLDRLAFLLEPDGVRCHWMTDGSDADPSGLSVENAWDEPAHRRGPAKLPLRAGQWNELSMSLRDGSVALELNGEPIFERPLSAISNPVFGLFHYKDRTVAEVRRVTLTGNWPAALSREQLSNLAAPIAVAARLSDAERCQKALLVGESFLALEAEEILRQARRLSPEERYDFLRAWVLPGADHAAFRLYGHFNQSATSLRDVTHLAERGGTLEAPALDLVATADQLGRLDQLAALVSAASARTLNERRGQAALLALVQAARKDTAAATAAFDRLSELARQAPSESSDHERWPEMTAAYGMLAQPALRAAAIKPLAPLVEEIKPNRPNIGDLERQLCHLQAMGQVLGERAGNQTLFGVDPQLAWWQVATRGTARTRGVGLPPPHWELAENTVVHYPGHGEDRLYLAVPLRGDFVFQCETNWRDVDLCYANIQVGLRRPKRAEVARQGRAPTNVPLDPPLQLNGLMRLETKAGQVTFTIGGREIHRERLADDHDPWLCLRAQGHRTSNIKNLSLTGQPIVPRSVNLAPLSNLDGWLCDYYQESVSTPATLDGGFSRAGALGAWEKRGDEIYGVSAGTLEEQRNRAAGSRSPYTTNSGPAIIAGSKQESVLQYHRPLLEDGQLEYEFFYEPGKTLVHPALDRLALLLDPEGVKVHWLTDAQYERSGLAPDNAQAMPADRKGPAKLPMAAGQWNRMELRLSGNRVTLLLNKEEVYQRELEPGNQRLFGLFHYADESDVRVRHVRWSGNWSDQAPRSEQLLATQPR